MLYPFDASGVAASNRVVAEVHAVSPPETINDASLIVPRMTPFFKEGLVVKFGSSELIEGVDYILVFHHLSLSAHLTRSVFGGISFRNREFTGTVKITYQVVGGDFQLGDTEILEKLTRRLGHFQYVTFDQIVGTPSSFPPDFHLHDLETSLVEMGDVVDSLEKMSREIAKQPGSLGELSTRLDNHMDENYAHNKGQVGLGNVENLRTASLADIVSGKVKRFVTSDVLAIYIGDYLANNAPDNSGLEAQVAGNASSITNLFFKLSQAELAATAATNNVSKAIAAANAATSTATNALNKANTASTAATNAFNKATAADKTANSALTAANAANTAIGKIVPGLSTSQVNTLITNALKPVNTEIANLKKLVGTGGGGTGGGKLVSKVQVSISSKSQWFNSGTVTSTATIVLKELLPMTLVSSTSKVYSSGTVFVLNLPSTYNPSIHRVSVSGGGYAVDDTAKTVRVTAPTTRSENYSYEVGDEGRTGTRYYCTGSFTVEVLTK